MAHAPSPDPAPSPDAGGPGDSRSGPLVIGLLGGVASGKSTVAAALGELGCAVADADRICHEALREPRVREAVINAFGSDIRGPDGEIDRARLRPTFDEPEALARLEAILHPIVVDRTRRIIEDAARDGRAGVVVDAPLLLESGLDRLCDVLVLIELSRATRRARARGRGMGEADWERRERRQFPVAEKRMRAHATIDGNPPPDEVRRQVTDLWNRLTGPK
jgi:dephospho-CoA kinase